MATQPVPSENALKLHPLNNDGSRPTTRSSFRNRGRRHHDNHHYVYHFQYFRCFQYFQYFRCFHHYFHRSRHIHNCRSRRSPSLPS
jgi:hypothetical protein